MKLKENYKSKIVLFYLRSSENEKKNIAKLNFSPVLGFRPFSFDGQPMFGKLNNEISIVSGTKRWFDTSSLIADEIIKEVQIKNYKSKLFYGWSLKKTYLIKINRSLKSLHRK